MISAEFRTDAYLGYYTRNDLWTVCADTSRDALVANAFALMLIEPGFDLSNSRYRFGAH
jgi:hypothetical protein